jgi:hypothetical protein
VNECVPAKAKAAGLSSGRLDEAPQRAPRENRSLTARPQYEAYAHVIYFDFFFAFFFFAAMVLFLLRDDPTAGLSSSLRRCLGPVAIAPLAEINDGTGQRRPQLKNRK